LRILLINPRFPDSLWSLTGISDIVGAGIGQTPLGLITVAALTPPGHELRLVDENVRPIDFAERVDLVAIGAMNVQFGRAAEIARRFRERGVRTAIGGPYVSLVPERAVGLFDHRLVGEAEYIWPRFISDLEAGQPVEAYVQEANVPVTDSPVPRFDLLSPDRYLDFFIQTSRGCPFACEFCDIIITDGRVPRVKPVAQVMAEIEAVHKIGGRSIAFSDANFIGNPRYAKGLLIEMAAWNKARGFPIRFGCELTLNVAEKPDLLRLLREANFESIFIGIESPRATSLMETRKVQNVRGEMIERIRTIQRHNIIVIAGMIVGFDSDDTAIFEEQLDFLHEAGIPFTTAGVLTALERTPLHKRLGEEGRLLDWEYENMLGHGAADLNFEPMRMTKEELLEGYNWLARSLYSYKNYSRRLVEAVRHFQRTTTPGQAGSDFNWRTIRILARTAHYYLLRGGREARRFFLSTMREAARSGLPAHKLVPLIAYLVAHKHFHAYVRAHHGDPESAPERSPFHGVAPREPRAFGVGAALAAEVPPSTLPAPAPAIGAA
jgi:radical SAM superfamily enzyme YgiQ (UPF0313 family)